MNDIVNDLQNQEVRGISRAADMCSVSFGEIRFVKDYKGNIVESGTYFLHLQCPWRIVDNSSSKIVIASYDMYEPNSSTQWTEEFDWDVRGANLFDEKVEKWKNKKLGHVLEVNISQFGDLRIRFSNGWELESFMSLSTDSEAWRFFKDGSKDAHMVCNGLGIEY